MQRRAVIVLGLIAMAIVASGTLLFLLAPQAPEEEFTLGPTRRHTRGTADVIARVAKGGLDAAAGSADREAFSPIGLVPTDRELAFVVAVNADRAAYGLGTLDFDGVLLPLARNRAAAQSGGPLSHFDGFGQIAFVGLLAETDISYSLAGENLARATRSDPTLVTRLEQTLMNSPTHRANILDPSFSRLAVGEAQEGSAGGIAFAQIFVAGPE